MKLEKVEAVWRPIVTLDDSEGRRDWPSGIVSRCWFVERRPEDRGVRLRSRWLEERAGADLTAERVDAFDAPKLLALDVDKPLVALDVLMLLLELMLRLAGVAFAEGWEVPCDGALTP